MPKKTQDEAGAEIFRQIERRIVWVAAFLVNRGTSKALNSGCAKAADEALAEYEQRFPAILPPL